MSDGSDRPSEDDLDDELTIEGDDDVLAMIRRQASERAAGAPPASDPAGPTGDAPVDDLDDDATIGDPDVLDAIRRRAASSADPAASNPHSSANGPPPPPAPQPSAGADPEWPGSSGTETGGAPTHGSVSRAADPDDPFDDPTVGAPEDHPSRSPHPLLGSGSLADPPPLPPMPASGPPSSGHGVPQQSPPLPDLPPAAAAGQHPGTDDEPWTPGGTWAASARARPSEPSSTAPPPTRSMPPWLVPALAGVVVLAVLLFILL